MSINGVAYVTWSTGGDVLAARLERVATTFNGVPGPLDIDPAAIAGTGTGRPKVAVAAEMAALAGQFNATHNHTASAAADEEPVAPPPPTRARRLKMRR